MDSTPDRPRCDGLGRRRMNTSAKCAVPVIDRDIFEVVADGDIEALMARIAFTCPASLAALRSKKPEEHGRNLLHCAVSNGRADILKVLLNHPEFDPNQVDSVYTRSTPLMEAAKFARLDLIELLFKAGARLDTQDVNGDTCLHWAAREVSAVFLRQVLELARENGSGRRHLTAVLELTNANGKTAADVGVTEVARRSIARILSGEDEPGRRQRRRERTSRVSSTSGTTTPICNTKTGNT